MPNQKPVSRIPKLSYNRIKAEIHMDNDCQSVTSSSCAESISSTTSTISTRTTGSRLTVASLRRKSRLPDIRSPNTRKAGLGHHHGRIVGVTARRSNTNTNNNVNSRTRPSSSYRNDGKSLDRNTNISNHSDVGKDHDLHQTTGNRTNHKSGAARQQDTHTVTGITCISPIDTHKGSIGADHTQSPSPTMPNSKNDKKGLPNRPRIGQRYGGRDDRNRSCGYSISSTRRTRLHADHTTCTTSSPYQEVTSTPTRISALQKKKTIGIQSSGMRGGARRVQVNSSSNPKKISSRKVRDSMNSNPKPKHGNVTTAHVAASVPVPVPVPVTPEADSSKLQLISTSTTRFHNAGSDLKMNHVRIVSPTQTPPSETLPTFKLISSKSSMNSKRLSSARRIPISSR